MAKTSKNKKKNNLLLLCFWVLVLLLIVAVFFARRNDIKKNLNDTDFFGRVFGKTPSFVVDKNEKSADSDTAQKKIDIDLLSKKESERYTEATGTEANKTSPIQIETVNTEDRTSAKKDADADSEKTVRQPESSRTETQPAKESSAEKEAGKKVPETVAKTEVTLYFIVINSDGSVSRRTAKRLRDRTNSPLTDSINTLLAGPTLDEKSKDMMSLIPAGTRLLGASVKNGTATLNFSENFEFNSVGVEGYIAQLMQIVYTATEFSTVKNVQFLIEGEKKDYLGSEGQWIGSPLARSSF